MDRECLNKWGQVVHIKEVAGSDINYFAMGRIGQEEHCIHRIDSKLEVEKKSYFEGDLKSGRVVHEGDVDDDPTRKFLPWHRSTGPMDLLESSKNKK